MSKYREVHAAIIRMAGAEREARSEFVKSDKDDYIDSAQFKEKFLELLEAAKTIRKIYERILESCDISMDDELKTVPRYMRDE